MHPIRVLHVIDTLGAAGAEHQLATLLPSLRQCGVECEVAVLQSPYTLQPLFEDRGIRVHRLGAKNGRNILVTTSRLGALLRHERYDIVHAHLWHSITATALSRLLSRREKRVLTFHNSEYQQFPVDSLVRWLRRGFDKAVLRFGIDRCTAVTEFIARSNEHLLGLRDVKVIFNGLDLTSFARLSDGAKREVRRRLNCQDDDFLVVTAGRLAAQKGHSILIDAVGLLTKEGLRIRTFIFGEGPLRQQLQQKIGAMGLESLVTLPGAVEHQELFQAIASADVFAFPSINEPFGLAAAEAMALGTPVVASATDGLPELIEDGVSGRLVPLNDAAALAHAIREMMGNPDLRTRFALAGYARARDFFDVAKISAELASLYRSSLALPSIAESASKVSV